MSFKHKRKVQKEAYKERRAERAVEKERNTARKLKRPAFTEYVPKQSRHVESDAMQRTRAIPSHNNGADPIRQAKAVPVPSERELAARAQSEKLKTQIAPLYPKGAYQLITDPNAPKYFAKKDAGL